MRASDFIASEVDNLFLDGYNDNHVNVISYAGNKRSTIDDAIFLTTQKFVDEALKANFMSGQNVVEVIPKWFAPSAATAFSRYAGNSAAHFVLNESGTPERHVVIPLEFVIRTALDSYFDSKIKLYSYTNTIISSIVGNVVKYCYENNITMGSIVAGVTNYFYETK
jgi:hypothetical protein